jgi:hypothetical protein
MNFLEHFAIAMVLGLLQQVVKNPAKKAELQAVLVGTATDIFVAYGMTPPDPAPALAAAPARTPIA